ncbi:MAG TPA: ABC transporter permease [Candidatus Hydrogenedentes bacterium]|nr:ABC transporter permease [Candidatus Hydrogenedentota bacterium]
MSPKGHKKQSYWRLVWRQFRRNRLAILGLVLIALLFVVALGAPFIAGERPIGMKRDGKTYWLSNVINYKDLVAIDFRDWEPAEGDWAIRPPIPHSPLSQKLRDRLEKPCKKHLLGTDDRGRDVLSRMVWGTRISISIGFVAVGIAVLIGVFFGALAGYYGGVVDAVVQRLIEIMMCIPSFFLIITLIAFLPPSIYNIMIVIGITGWTGVARLVRGEFLKLREGDFATAARATGLNDARIMFRHLLPNALSPVLVSATFGIAGAILTESGLSFLGFGVPPPTASWGEVLKQSQRFVDFAWWLVVFPGAAIFITVTAFNLVGEGLRDAMDPRLRE